MPKVLLTNKDRREDKVRRLINHARDDGITKKQIHQAMGISEAAFYARQKSPGKFSLDEIWKLCDLLHVPDDKRLEILK